MQILDNINTLWGDDLKKTLRSGSKLKIAASCFSIYAFEALKKELEKIDSLEFIFTAPAFVPNAVTDKFSRERREFHIHRLQRECSLYGSEFEIQLKNKLTQRAVAKECADWIRRKAKFRSKHSGLRVTPPPGRYWRCNKKTYDKWLDKGRIWFGKSGDGRPMLKKYIADVQERLTPETWWGHKEFGSNKSASTKRKEILNGKQYFDTPKPTSLLERLIQLGNDKNGIFLDFFCRFSYYGACCNKTKR